MKKNFSLLCVPSIKAKKEWILSCNLSWIKFYISLDIIAYNSIKYYVYLYCDEDGSSNFLLTGKLKVTNRERRSPAESLFVEEHNLRTHWSIFYCIGKNQQFIEFIVIVLFPYATRLGILRLSERSEWHIFRTCFRGILGEMPFLYYIFLAYCLQIVFYKLDIL